MRKAIGKGLAWAFYWLGDFVSRLGMIETGRGYGLYSWAMTTSCDWQDWGGGGGPWTEAWE